MLLASFSRSYIEIFVSMMRKPKSTSMLFTQKGEMTKILQYYPDIQTQNVFA
jgi:hypothetical protein